MALRLGVRVELALRPPLHWLRARHGMRANVTAMSIRSSKARPRSGGRPAGWGNRKQLERGVSVPVTSIHNSPANWNTAAKVRRALLIGRQTAGPSAAKARMMRPTPELEELGPGAGPGIIHVTQVLGTRLGLLASICQSTTRNQVMTRD